MTDLSLSYIDGKIVKDADALLERYEIALFTSFDSVMGDPSFGIGLDQFISEPNDAVTSKAIASVIKAKSNVFPEIKILSIALSRPQINQITIDLSVMIVPYGIIKKINKNIGA